jgi:HlyD family secretion protein
MKRIPVLIEFLIVVAVGITAYAMRPKPKDPAAPARRVRTQTVGPATLDVSLRVSGVLQAANSHPIINTSRQSQIVWMLPDGCTVKQGDVVMRLDDTALHEEVVNDETANADAEESTKQGIEDAKKRVQNAESALEKTKDDLLLAQVNTKDNLDKDAADIEYQRKELEVSKGNLDKYSRLASGGLVTRPQLQQYQDAYRLAQFAVAKSQRNLEQDRKDGQVTEAVKQYDIKKAELELQLAKSSLEQTQKNADRDQLQRTRKLADAEAQLAQSAIRATASGMLLIEQTWDDGSRPLRVGDKVSEQRRVATVVDPSQMEVRCDINERDIEHVKIGQKAHVRIAALGGLLLNGSVKAVDNLAREQAWWEGGVPGKKAFSAIITLAGRDKRLRPGMSATADVVLSQMKTSTAVPAECLFARGGRTVAFRLEGDHFEEVQVQVAARTEMQAAISRGLKPGDELACELPSATLLVGAGGRTQ